VRAELVDRLRADRRVVGRREEQAQPVGAARGVLGPRRSGDDEHPVRLLDAADPDLLAIDAPAVAVLDRGRARRERVASGLGLGERHAEREVPARDTRQEAAPLLLAPMPLDRDAAEHRRQHEELRDRGAAPGAAGLLDDDGHLAHAEAGAAVLLRDRDPDPARLREGAPELVRVGVLGVLALPVLEVERRDARTHGLTQLAGLRAEHHVEVHPARA
jgi:hypothetical protein